MKFHRSSPCLGATILIAPTVMSIAAIRQDMGPTRGYLHKRRIRRTIRSPDYCAQLSLRLGQWFHASEYREYKRVADRLRSTALLHSDHAATALGPIPHAIGLPVPANEHRQDSVKAGAFPVVQTCSRVMVSH